MGGAVNETNHECEDRQSATDAASPTPDGAEANRGPQPGRLWFEPPTLPEETDITLSSEAGKLRVEFAVRDRKRLDRLGNRWLWAVLFCGLAALGLLAAGAYGLLSGGFSFADTGDGVRLALAFALMLGFLTFLVASVIPTFQRAVVQRSTSVLLDAEALHIQDKQHGRAMTAQLAREATLQTAVRRMRKREVYFTQDGTRRRLLPGLWWGASSVLVLIRDAGELAMLKGWRNADLRWITSCIQVAWGTPIGAGGTAQAGAALDPAAVQEDSANVTMSIFVLVFAAALLPVAAVYGGDVYHAWASRNWPRVQGVVVQAQYSPSETAPRQSAAQADVRYTYEVNGRRYENDEIGFTHHPDSELVKSLLAGLRPGTPTSVHYKPNDPAVSTLLPGMGLLGKVFAVFGVLLVMLAPVQLVLGWRSHLRQRQRKRSALPPAAGQVTQTTS